MIFMELLNEPPIADGVWIPMARTLLETVRDAGRDNYALVGPAPYQRLDALTAWEPFADQRVVYACHYYSPMVFTHQGADWEKDSPWGRAEGVPVPSGADDASLTMLARRAQKLGDEPLARELQRMARQACNAQSIDAEFATLAEWSARRNAPVIVDEFGVLKRKVKPVHRLAWILATRRAAEAHGFGWAHWDYASDFGLLDESGALDAGVIRALLSP